MTDADLSARIKQGDREAARELVRLHYASVLRFLHTLCRNPDDAEELAQDTFVRALNKFNGFRGDSGLRTWLHRIAYHEFTHRHRRTGPTQMAVELRSQPFESASALALDLDRALAGLSEEACTAFVLCEIQGLSIQEAATVLRIPAGTVKSRVFTARKQLQAALAPEPEVNLHVAKA